MPQDEAEQLFYNQRQLYANFKRLWHLRFDREQGVPTYAEPTNN